MLHEDVDDCPGIPDEVIRVELQFFKFGILSHEILDGVFEFGDNRVELLFSGRCLDVKDDFVFDSEFAGDRQRVGGGTSMVEVINRDLAHDGR